MIVAFHVPHNEGVQAGIITSPGFDSETSLVDLYEVDASIKSFDTLAEAQDWLKEVYENDDEDLDFTEVPGGLVASKSDDDD